MMIESNLLESVSWLIWCAAGGISAIIMLGRFEKEKSRRCLVDTSPAASEVLICIAAVFGGLFGIIMLLVLTDPPSKS